MENHCEPAWQLLPSTAFSKSLNITTQENLPYTTDVR